VYNTTVVTRSTSRDPSAEAETCYLRRGLHGEVMFVRLWTG